MTQTPHHCLREVAQLILNQASVPETLQRAVETVLPDWSKALHAGEDLVLVFSVPIDFEQIAAEVSEPEDRPEWLDEELAQGIQAGSLTKGQRERVAARWAEDACALSGHEFDAVLWSFEWEDGLQLCVLDELEFHDHGDYRRIGVRFAIDPTTLLGFIDHGCAGAHYVLTTGA